MTTAVPLEDLARQALDGDREALERLVGELQGDVYGVAIRMLWNREDAEDATQEILIRVVTHLAQFDGRSRLRTWVYRIAVNYLLDVRKSPVERMRLSFQEFADDLSAGLSDEGPGAGERSLLVEEVKIGCTLAMLQCLDRPHRLAYILGESLELSGPDAAEALGISPALFRKRLQHARESVMVFTRTYCGLASDSAACACHRRVTAAVAGGRIGEARIQFAEGAASFDETRSLVRRVDEARRALTVHRTSRPRGTSVDFARRLVATLERAERGT